MLKFHDAVVQVAEELHLKADSQVLYNCHGIVETMRRSKGLVLAGPICSGKTQLVKLCIIALKRSFNVTMRSSFLTPSTFTEEELYGPTQAFDASVHHDDSADKNSLKKSVL